MGKNAATDDDSAATGPTRTAMGEYIVPPGGKTLTSLGDFLPAPSDYSPKVDITKPSAPQYSVGGPYKFPKADYHASPADNDTSRDLTWSDRSIHLKGKGKMRSYDIRDDAEVNDSVGPAKYRVEHGTVGKEGPKINVGKREAVMAGPPNHLVQPVDTPGVKNPGPKYRPSSKYQKGPQKSFGLSRQDRNSEGPGPAEYTLSEIKDGAAYSLAKRLPPPLQWQQAINKESPGPGSYELGTTVGKAVSKSITSRNYVDTTNLGPAPNLYSLPDRILNQNAATLTYRSFSPKDTPHPGPTRYTLTDTGLPRAPHYTVRTATRPCFPDILNYPLIAQTYNPPGPGTYHNEEKTFSSNDAPKFSMGKRAKPQANSVPGPNHYKVADTDKPSARRPPAFSMGMRLGASKEKVSPGPAAYYPTTTIIKKSGGYSMTRRPRDIKKFNVPAPNAYKLDKGQTHKGGVPIAPAATFKSRATPYVYSGFRTSVF